MYDQVNSKDLVNLCLINSVRPEYIGIIDTFLFDILDTHICDILIGDPISWDSIRVFSIRILLCYVPSQYILGVSTLELPNPETLIRIILFNYSELLVMESALTVRSSSSEV